MYAASIALKKGIPFLGGEPTRAEQMQVLKGKGFTEADIAFNALLGAFSQALRSGDLVDTSIEHLKGTYPRLAAEVSLPLDHGGWNLEPPTLVDFQQHYYDLYGVEFVGDRHFRCASTSGMPRNTGRWPGWT
jgi:hypothetical protein